MTTVDELREQFASEPTTTRPMMRWWWFGPEVDDAEVARELAAMAAGGISGVEVAYVYPLDEVGSGFLSPRFLASLRHAAERARDLGLRFDLTLGTGWSFGGPHITADLAARGLTWVRRELLPGPLTIPATAPFPGDALVGAYLGQGSIQESPQSYDLLPITEAGVAIPDDRGPRQVLLAYSRLTGQNVKRAAYEAEGPVLDHYSAAATEAHLRAVGDVLLDAVPAELIGSVFCDSLEVYDADWTPDLPAEFEARRGYALVPRLWELHVDTDTSTAFRADYFRTLTELYEERFAAVMQRWAHERGVRFRIQGYGQPPAAISSYRYADLIEGEGWGWKDLTQARWATSAAHLYGQRVCSSETWTWNHSPSFRSTPLDLQGEAHDHLLQGINQFCGHGWPYTSPSADGVGYLFYASGAYDDRNPWYGPAMHPLTSYLGRLCAVLQADEPVADITILVPTHDASALLPRSLDLWKEVRAAVGDDLTAAIRTNGWDFDLVDDRVMEAPARERAVILVPAATVIPERTERWLAEMIESGSRVVLVGGRVEVPGALRVTRADLVSTVRQVCPPDVLVEPADDIGVTHRRLADAEVYLVANTGPMRREVTITPRTAAAGFEVWDARSGSVVGRVAGPTVALVLEAYEAAVVIGVAAAVEAVAVPEAGSAVPVGPWSVIVNGTEQPVDLPHQWELSTGLERYCGSLTYASTFDLEQVPTTVVVDLGQCRPAPPEDPEQIGMRGRSFRADVLTPVGEVAEVRVNGVACGVVWAPPYVVDVTPACRTGQNRIEIIVSSTLAHAVADDPYLAPRADAANERYGQRFAMQELHLADLGVRSGLLATPTVHVIAPSPLVGP